MIKVKNIYWMLAYAFDILKEKSTQSVKTEEFDNIYDLLSAMLIKGVNYQVKRGMNREYIDKKEELINLKGKILISDSIKYNTIKNHKLICEYDDFSINSYMNKIIKSTLVKLIKVKSLDKKYKISIKKILLYFKDVDIVDIRSINWKGIRYNKNNLTYKMLINICYLIIEGLLLSNEKGDKLLKQLDEKYMEALYERFVREYYRKHFPSLHANASHIKWNVKEDYGIELLPIMKTDITLTYKEKTLIIDTKYYGEALQNNIRFNSITFRNAHLYQIFTYVKNKDVNNTGNVFGMLLYAKTEEELFKEQKNTFGNNVIEIKNLDLTKDFKLVEKQLDDIAYNFTDNKLSKKY